MQLTRFTDYALRALIQMAAQEKRLSIADIERAFGISRNHVAKVVHKLGQLGYIRTIRGPHGGLELARDPHAITIGDVVRDFEENMDLLECFNHQHNTCPLVGACILQGALHRARAAFMAELDALTLADAIANRATLISKLSTSSR